MAGHMDDAANSDMGVPRISLGPMVILMKKINTEARCDRLFVML